MLKEHEDQIGKKDTQDFMDILLKVYQDDKAEVKMTKINLKAFLFFYFFYETNFFFPFFSYIVLINYHQFNHLIIFLIHLFIY